MNVTFQYRGHTFVRQIKTSTNNIIIRVIDPTYDIIIFEEKLNKSNKKEVLFQLAKTLQEWMNELYIKQAINN